jgi:threonyl-tRNA synthetase
VGPKGVGQEKGDSRDEKKQDEGYLLMYPRYEKDYMEGIKPQHKPPEKLYEKTGLWAVTAMRWSFDKITGYPHNMNEDKWLQRVVFLETVAGVPGMSGAMLRHLSSLRTMKRDNGWIHTLLEEAENERMHLLTFMQLRHPGPLFRAFVLLTQGVFFNLYTFFYLLSPKHCHAFVGYLEEEAVKTYTHCLVEIDQGKLPAWSKKSPPEFAKHYWGLGEQSTMRDLILAVRADEYSHSHVNHAFSKMKPSDVNPFEKGAHVVPQTP